MNTPALGRCMVHSTEDSVLVLPSRSYTTHKQQAIYDTLNTNYNAGPYLRGVYGLNPPPRNYNKKVFSLYKNYMLHNMWPLVLGQKPLKCQEKPSGVYKMQQTTDAAGAPPRTPLGEPTPLPRPPSWWGGAGCPLPKNPIPTLGLSGLAYRF